MKCIFFHIIFEFYLNEDTDDWSHKLVTHGGVGWDGHKRATFQSAWKSTSAGPHFLGQKIIIYEDFKMSASLFYVFSVVPWMTRTMLCVWFHLHCHDIILLLQPWTNLSFLNWFLPLTIKVIGQVIIKCLELKGILENLHSTRVASIHHLWDKICYFCK